MRYFIGLDNGGTATKAAVFDEHGCQLGSYGMATLSTSLYPGFVERDMDEMWAANCKVIRGVLERSGIRGEDVTGVGVCGHGKGLYLWGRDDRPARLGIASTDARAQPYIDEWMHDGTADKAFKLSCQEIIACQPPALLAWIRDHEPSVYANIKYVFECKDYIRFMLTGNARAELSDYSGTSLLNLHTRSFDPKLFKLFGISEMLTHMPEPCLCNEVAGHICAEAAAATGLQEGTPVVGGFFDIDACAVGSGVISSGRVCMIAGTWSINEYVRSAPVLDGSVSKNSCFCLPGYYLIEESSPTSAGNNEWFVRKLLPDVCDEAATHGASVYDVVGGWVESLSPTNSVPLFLPYLMGSNVSPFARGAFIGLTDRHTRAHLARSVYEGIAYCHRQHYEKLLVSMEERPDAIRLSGGVARSRVWAQIFADVMGTPIETIDAKEVGALGCAIAASVACGVQPDIDAAVDAMVRVAERFEPNPEAARSYEKRYQAYCKVAVCLDDVWESVAELDGEQKSSQSSPRR